LDEAAGWNDTGRMARLTDEKEQLASALAGAVGLGGRSRRAASNVERARVNVQRRIKDILRRIGKVEPSLGHHLAATVRTGTCCSYRPEAPRAPR
jgi:hypothetical protein